MNTKTNMKTFIASIAIVSIAGMGVFAAAGAATEGTVAATVTSELVAISVADGGVSYGILAVNTEQDTVALGETQVVTNTGNVDVDLSVKSSDAVGGAGWNLVAAVGSLDEFTHKFSSNGGSTYTGFNVVNATYTSLVAGVIPTGTQNLDLRIKTPTSVSDQNVEKTITVTVLATI